MYSIIQIASFYRYRDENIGLRKMYYLIYYAWSWYIYIYGYELFIDSSKVQPYGIVYYDLKNKWNNKDLFLEKEIKNDDIIIFLNKIYDSYGKLSVSELNNLFIKELPYLNAKGKRLDIRDIIDEYKKR